MVRLSSTPSLVAWLWRWSRIKNLDLNAATNVASVDKYLKSLVFERTGFIGCGNDSICLFGITTLPPLDKTTLLLV